MKPVRISMFLLVLLAAACSSGHQETPSEKATDTQGREETKNIRALDAVGVEGTAISKQVDQALDTNDKRKEELDKELKSQQ
jgi:hypothetical protein